jgi:hypothetical protein
MGREPIAGGSGGGNQHGVVMFILAYPAQNSIPHSMIKPIFYSAFLFKQ